MLRKGFQKTNDDVIKRLRSFFVRKMSDARQHHQFRPGQPLLQFGGGTWKHRAITIAPNQQRAKTSDLLVGVR